MRSRRSIMTAVFMGVLLLVATGCGQAAADRAASGAGASGRGVDLDFTGTTVNGDSFDGQRLAGKPAVLWFWAPWCPTCHAQTPSVNDVAETYDGQVNVVGVGGLDDAAAIRDYADNISDDATVLVDGDGAVWRHFGVTAQSTFVVVDANGQIVAEGYLDGPELAGRVADLVS